MEINNFKWRPVSETIIQFDGKYYYATLCGINIIELNFDGFKVLFSEEQENFWGAFHFAVLYRNNVVFCPHVVDYLYVYDLHHMRGKKIEIPKRKKDEYLMPFISEGQLCLLANMTSRVYTIANNWKISVNSEDDDKMWKMIRQRANLQCICMWSGESYCVKYIAKDERQIYEIDIPNWKCYNAVSDGTNMYIVAQNGKLLIYDLSKGVIKKIISVAEKMNNGKLFLLRNSLFFLPGTGCEVVEVSLLGDNSIRNYSLNLELNNKSIAWTILDDERVIGIAQDKEVPWKEDIIFFEYSPISNTYVELPIDEIIKKQLLTDCKGVGMILNEDNDYGIEEYLQLIMK